MDGTCEDIRGREIDVNDSKLHSAHSFSASLGFHSQALPIFLILCLSVLD